MADAAAGLTVAEAQVTITDNDDRGVTVTPTKLEVTEGGSDSYTVVLTSEPTDEVTVAVNVPAGAEFTVDKTDLTFAVGAWETEQTVTVRAGRDDDAVAATPERIEHEVTGGDYAGEAAAAVAVTVLEVGHGERGPDTGVRGAGAHRHGRQRRGDAGGRAELRSERAEQRQRAIE